METVRIVNLPIAPREGALPAPKPVKRLFFPDGPPVVHEESLYSTNDLTLNYVVGVTNNWSLKHLRRDAHGTWWYIPSKKKAAVEGQEEEERDEESDDELDESKKVNVTELVICTGVHRSNDSNMHITIELSTGETHPPRKHIPTPWRPGLPEDRFKTREQTHINCRISMDDGKGKSVAKKNGEADIGGGQAIRKSAYAA